MANRTNFYGNFNPSPPLPQDVSQTGRNAYGHPPVPRNASFSQASPLPIPQPAQRPGRSASTPFLPPESEIVNPHTVITGPAANAAARTAVFARQAFPHRSGPPVPRNVTGQNPVGRYPAPEHERVG